MSLTHSNMMKLGSTAPDFKLPDTISGQDKTLQELKSDVATVILFICNHCPYVIHIQDKIVEIAKQYQTKGIRFIAISSNDVENYPADSPENMKKHAEQYQFSFPYLYDDTQAVAKAYQAACTPDCYIFNKDLKCIYRGRFDEASPGKDAPVTGKDLSQALDQVLANEPVNTEQFSSMGCNIKWKS